MEKKISFSEILKKVYHGHCSGICCDHVSVNTKGVCFFRRM